MRRYRRSAMGEPIRRLLRASDLLILLTALRLRRRLPGIRTLRRMTYVELGPGPMRLAGLKRILFRKVYYLDISDYGVPDPGLKIFDMENCADVRAILELLPEDAAGGGVLLFADHCLEHISEQVVTRFLDSIVEQGLGACFRVPNIHSKTGSKNYAGDSTHRTPFGETLRQKRVDAGYSVFPWIRWYRPKLVLLSLTGRAVAMAHAEEIVLSAICAGSRKSAQVGRESSPRVETHPVQ